MNNEELMRRYHAASYPDVYCREEEAPTSACCVCNAQNVEVSRVIAYGIETFVCDPCSGEDQ